MEDKEKSEERVDRGDIGNRRERVDGIGGGNGRERVDGGEEGSRIERVDGIGGGSGRESTWRWRSRRKRE